MRGLAINVGANTGMPGFRGPILPDGGFEYVPIPEREPTREPVPTYGDLGLEVTDVGEVADRPVHLDPAFAGYPYCDRYSYGDEHGVKARPIGRLEAGDRLFFYATLTPFGEHHQDWIADGWGAYLIGDFRLTEDPVRPSIREEVSEAFDGNAHVKRETFDADVLVRGDPDASALYETAVPLSAPEGGAVANDIVIEASDDSGDGPWWRRPLAFDRRGVDRVLEERDRRDAVR